MISAKFLVPRSKGHKNWGIQSIMHWPNCKKSQISNSYFFWISGGFFPLIFSQDQVLAFNTRVNTDHVHIQALIKQRDVWTRKCTRHMTAHCTTLASYLATAIVDCYEICTSSNSEDRFIMLRKKKICNAACISLMWYK
jgi:hypothetical protein